MVPKLFVWHFIPEHLKTIPSVAISKQHHHLRLQSVASVKLHIALIGNCVNCSRKRQADAPCDELTLKPVKPASPAESDFLRLDCSCMTLGSSSSLGMPAKKNLAPLQLKTT
jgi:hypothetical protein